MSKNNKSVNEKVKVPAKGFGFGEAMFNMKDLVSDYSQFN